MKNNALIMLAMCPGTSIVEQPAEVCKVCPYFGSKDCGGRLKNDVLFQLQHSTPAVNKTSLETHVAEVLHELGVPAHLLGYRYLRFTLCQVVEDENLTKYMTTELYPKVAREFDTSWYRVERAIRHAIEIAWDRGNPEVLHKWFGWTISGSKGKPTNTEFIALVADRIRTERKSSKL